MEVMEKKILFLDMDGVLANLGKAINQIRPDLDIKIFHSDINDIFVANPDMFQYLEPIEGAVEAVHELSKCYDVHFLSTPVDNVPSTYSGKRIWLDKYFGEHAQRKLTLTHHKNIALGDFLVDDNIKFGVDKFRGIHIHFGSDKFPDWKTTLPYLLRFDFWDGWITDYDKKKFYADLRREGALYREVEGNIKGLTEKQVALLGYGRAIKFCANTEEIKFMDTDLTWH